MFHFISKKAENSISRFPDRELKFPESGNISSGPDKSGIGKPELAIPSADMEALRKKERNGLSSSFGDL